MINNIPNKLLKEEPKDKNDNIQKAVSVEQIKIEDDDPSKLKLIKKYFLFLLSRGILLAKRNRLVKNYAWFPVS